MVQSDDHGVDRRNILDCMNSATMSKTLVVATALAALGTVSVTPVTALAQTAGAVSIDNFAFNPPQLRVKVGNNVTWTNKDDTTHGIASDDNAFNRSQRLANKDNFSVTFSKPGTYRYHCYIHTSMVGTIVVEQATGSNARP